MLLFEERGKPKYWRKTSRGKDENQQQTKIFWSLFEREKRRIFSVCLREMFKFKFKFVYLPRQKKQNKCKKDIYYRESGEEALGFIE